MKGYSILHVRGSSASSPSTQNNGTGAHILAKGASATLENDQGYVTPSCFSPNVGSTIGLALVERGPDRHREDIVVWNALAAEFTPAVLCDPVFVDPANEKLNA